MSEKTYRILFQTFLYAALVLILHSAWQWGAPWFMRASMKQVMPLVAKTCKETPGCVKVEAWPAWSISQQIYVPRYQLVIRKNMPKSTQDNLINSVQAFSIENPGLLYRSWMQKPYVAISYE